MALQQCYLSMKDKDINKGEKTLKRSELLLMTSFYQHRYNNFQESEKKKGQAKREKQYIY